MSQATLAFPRAPLSHERDLPAVVGFVPPELRAAFSMPLPIVGYDNQQPYTTEWNIAEEVDADVLHPDIRHLWPVIELAVTLGGLSLQPNAQIRARVRQGDASDFFTAGLGWHSDRGEDDGVYRRVIMSDALGTLYERNGVVETTPDYGMLVIDGASEHAPQQTTSSIRRTRLQVTRFALASL